VRIWQQMSSALMTFSSQFRLMSRLFGILWRRLLLSFDDDQWRMMPLMDELPAAVVTHGPPISSSISTQIKKPPKSNWKRTPKRK